MSQEFFFFFFSCIHHLKFTLSREAVRKKRPLFLAFFFQAYIFFINFIQHVDQVFYVHFIFFIINLKFNIIQIYFYN